MPEKVDEATADASVNVEDKVGLLLGGENLHLERIIQNWMFGEVLEGELLENGHSLICEEMRMT